MIAVNLNSRIINSANEPVWQLEQFRLGWDIFTARESLSACKTHEQYRGWWAALNAAANADTDAYLRGGNR